MYRPRIGSHYNQIITDKMHFYVIEVNIFYHYNSTLWFAANYLLGVQFIVYIVHDM